MATTYSRRILSNSSNGRPIEVQTIASPGTLVHTCGASATSHFEEIHLYAWNRATQDMPLALEVGGTATTDLLMASIPAQLGMDLVLPGFTLTATSSIIRAYTTGTATDSLAVGGWVNRAT